MSNPDSLMISAALGMPVTVSEAVEPSPAWWVRPHWWLDEDFRHKVNGSLFQAFGRRAHPPFYLIDPAYTSLLQGAPRNGRPKSIVTNEAGAMALREAIQ